MTSALKTNNGSFICSGSDFNRRSFGENESWNSLQSTILAGYLELSENPGSRKTPNLETVREESSMVVLEDDCNVLDMNIDAMSNDSVFGESQRSETDLNTEVVSFPDTVSSQDSGIIMHGTGYLLQRMFEDMEKCAIHSTPSDTGSNHPNFRTSEMSHRHFDFEHDSMEPSTSYDDLSRNSPMVIRHTRVSEMKQHFEDILKGATKSRIPVKKTSPTLKIYQANAQSKKSKIPVLKKPTASCSELPSRSGSRVRANRSKSESDSSNNRSVKVVWDNRHITLRRRVKAHCCLGNSPKQASFANSRGSSNRSSATSRSQKSASSLNTRKSLGFISSPIKSVQVIRKIFSPSPRSKIGTSHVNYTGRTNCTTNRFQTPGMPKKLRRDVPKIVVTSCRD